MAMTKGKTTAAPARIPSMTAKTDNIDKQIAQAKADKKTAGAMRATAKAKKMDNKANIQSKHGYSHGVIIGIFEIDGKGEKRGSTKAAGGAKNRTGKSGGAAKGTSGKTGNSKAGNGSKNTPRSGKTGSSGSAAAGKKK